MGIKELIKSILGVSDEPEAPTLILVTDEHREKAVLRVRALKRIENLTATAGTIDKDYKTTFNQVHEKEIEGLLGDISDEQYKVPDSLKPAYPQAVVKLRNAYRQGKRREMLDAISFLLRLDNQIMTIRATKQVERVA